MSRWKVKKFCDDFFSPDYCEWVAWPDVDWSESRAFPTHAEALAYADRKARTREYVLPSQPLPLTLPGVEDDAPIVATYDKDDCVYLTDQDDGDMVVLYKHELRPLALALLAHEERIKA